MMLTVCGPHEGECHSPGEQLELRAEVRHGKNTVAVPVLLREGNP